MHSFSLEFAQFWRRVGRFPAADGRDMAVFRQDGGMCVFPVCA
ncbi:MAG: hypothetical protein AAF787_12885 [Chloroflexota bacterium]